MEISHCSTAAPALSHISWILYFIIIRFQWLIRWHLPGLEECPIYPDGFSRVELIIHFRQNSKRIDVNDAQNILAFLENDGIFPKFPEDTESLASDLDNDYFPDSAGNDGYTDDEIHQRKPLFIPPLLLSLRIFGMTATILVHQ